MRYEIKSLGLLMLVGLPLGILTGCGARNPDSSTKLTGQGGANAATTPAPAPAPTPTSCPDKVDTLNVCDNGMCLSMGAQTFAMSGNGNLEHSGGGPVTAYVFRSFEVPPEQAAKKGLATGKAYVRAEDGAWKYLCDIDPTMSDAALAGKFKVQR